MKTTVLSLLLFTLAVVGCKESEKKAGDAPPVADDKANTAEPKADDKAKLPADKAEPAVEETIEGTMEATIGGEKMTFSHFPKTSNYLLKTNLGIQGFTEPGGASLQIVAVQRTLGPDTKYPYELRSATAKEQQAMLKAHQAALKAGKRSPMALAMVMLSYRGKDDVKLVDTGFVLNVESFDGSRLKGTFDGTLKPKKAKDKSDHVAVTDGKVDVVLHSPAAGRMIEKAATGQ
jgi:hypothetical protein